MKHYICRKEVYRKSLTWEEHMPQYIWKRKHDWNSDLKGKKKNLRKHVELSTQSSVEMQTKDGLEQWFSPVQVTTVMDRHIRKSVQSPEDFQRSFCCSSFHFHRLWAKQEHCGWPQDQRLSFKFCILLRVLLPPKPAELFFPHFIPPGESALFTHFSLGSSC